MFSFVFHHQEHMPHTCLSQKAGIEVAEIRVSICLTYYMYLGNKVTIYSAVKVVIFCLEFRIEKKLITV